MTLSDDGRVQISVWLLRTYQNSRADPDCNGMPISLPRDRHLWPDLALVQQHRRDISYKGGVAKT